MIVPPIAKEGSAPVACSATVSIDEVVVFPCVPATAILLDSDINSANAVARAIIGKPNSSALNRSGLFSEIAVEKTIRSAPSTFSLL